jgi:hypothetical protein
MVRFGRGIERLLRRVALGIWREDRLHIKLIVPLFACIKEVADAYFCQRTCNI